MYGPCRPQIADSRSPPSQRAVVLFHLEKKKIAQGQKKITTEMLPVTT